MNPTDILSCTEFGVLQLSRPLCVFPFGRTTCAILDPRREPLPDPLFIFFVV